MPVSLPLLLIGMPDLMNRWKDGGYQRGTTGGREADTAAATRRRIQIIRTDSFKSSLALPLIQINYTTYRKEGRDKLMDKYTTIKRTVEVHKVVLWTCEQTTATATATATAATTVETENSNDEDDNKDNDQINKEQHNSCCCQSFCCAWDGNKSSSKGDM